ncbi:MAG: hypothetical protein MH825_08130 [Cyanobacteria bacterium]|nr:hypothetical protein [Cyanobacteriota bacterium]
MSELKRVHWSELHGNPLLAKLHPQMIQSTFFDTKIAVLKGQGTKNGGAIKQQVVVAYDSTFVMAKLSATLIPLKVLGRARLEKLLSDVVTFIFTDENHSHSESNMGEDSNEGE